jgi:hypothetical protein
MTDFSVPGPQPAPQPQPQFQQPVQQQMPVQQPVQQAPENVVGVAPPPGFNPAAAAGSDDVVILDFTGASDDFEALPRNWYKLRIIDIQKGPNKAGTGTKLVWNFEVVEGDHKGRRLFTHANIEGGGNFQNRKVLKAFHSDLPKGPVPIALANYRGQLLWGLVQPQKDNPQYNEIVEYRNIAQAPPGSTGAMPAGIPASATNNQPPITRPI